MTGSCRVLDLDQSSYRASPLHDAEMPWQESNCYIDLWIELLHSLDMDVAACLAFTLTVDFEGDQWTFFKPPASDLRDLYGLRVEELALWRSIQDHCQEQLALGRPVLLEVDSFYLPDTAATDYRKNHVKTTIAVNDINVGNKHLGYFHNTGYFALGDEDYDGLFRLDRATPDDFLAPYAEVVKTAHLKQRSDTELRQIAMELLTRHLNFRPPSNPFERYAARYSEHFGWLGSNDMESYHAYVFATLRQCGAAFEFASIFLEWLSVGDDDSLPEATEQFRSISRTCKLLLLKLARSVAKGKEVDVSSQFEEMAGSWDRGFKALDRVVVGRA